MYTVKITSGDSEEVFKIKDTNTTIRHSLNDAYPNVVVVGDDGNIVICTIEYTEKFVIQIRDAIVITI